MVANPAQKDSRSMPRSLTRRQVRDVDARAIGEYGLPGIVLMENAGRGAAELLLRLGVNGRVVICAGKGNNGGDGYVIARHLELRDVATTVLLFCQPAELTGDAATNYRVLEAARQSLIVIGASPNVAELDRQLAAADWIVDALLGTGARGEPRSPLDAVIDQLNASPAPKVAVDLPSGLDCDTGEAAAHTIRAAHTCTFIAPKTGFQAPGADRYTGQVHVLDIGAPRQLVEEVLGVR